MRPLNTMLKDDADFELAIQSRQGPALRYT